MAKKTTIEKIGDEYGAKMRELLTDIGREMGPEYEVDGPYEMTDENYEWWLSVRPKGAPKEEGVDLRMQIAESQTYGDDPGGLNFMLDIGSYEGEVIGGVAPYNFTPEVWVKIRDAKAVAERWEEFTNVIYPRDIADLIVEWYEQA